MTTQKPCLLSCREEASYPSNGIGWRNSDGKIIHAPNCPNSIMRVSHEPVIVCKVDDGCAYVLAEAAPILQAQLDRIEQQSKPAPEPPNTMSDAEWNRAVLASEIDAQVKLAMAQDQIAALKAEVEAKYEENESWRHSYALLEAERQRLHDHLKHCSIIELMGENANVDSYVREWEARCLQAEAERDALASILARRAKEGK